jgi:membrane protein implicated in regulation of membrane protease activity
MYREDSKARSEAPLLSLARFGPGSLVFLSLIAIIAILFYLFSLKTFALPLGGVGVLFFGVKSMERIEVSRIEERKLVGEMCRVVKPVRRGQPGIVRMVKPDGTLESELWSAESINDIGVGEQARVVGRRSIVLLIDPLRQ